MNKFCSMEGDVLAVSHVFYMKPKLFFVALFDGEKVHCLGVGDPSQLQWQQEGKFKHGASYRITALKPVYLNKIKLFNATPNTVISPVEVSDTNSLTETVPLPSTGLVTVENCRILDSSNSKDGFYQLDNGLSLCYMFISTVTNAPLLRENQLVSIYHAHQVKNVLYLCGRSQVCLLNEPSETKYPKWDSLYRHNCLREMTFHYNWSSKSLLKAISLRNWLVSKFPFIPEECIHSTKNKISPLLMILIGHVRQLLSVDIVIRSLSHEFLQHDESCRITHEESWLKRFAVLDLDLGSLVKHTDSCDEWTNLSSSAEVGVSAGGSVPNWSCTVAASSCLHCSVRVLVGCLGFNHAGNWVLYNASHQIECVVEDCKGYLSPGEVVGRLIYVSKFLVYRETFTSHQREACHEKLYIRFSNQDMHLFDHHLVPLERETCVDCQEKQFAKAEVNSLGKSCLQKVYILSKTPLQYLNTKAGKSLGFGLQVQLIGSLMRTVPSDPFGNYPVASEPLQSSIRLSKGTANVTLVVLHQTHAFSEMQEGRYFDIHLPADTDPLFFQKDQGQIFKRFAGPRNVKQIILPTGTRFELAEQRTRLSLISENFHNVTECTDIIHEHTTIRGIVVDRFQVPSKLCLSDRCSTVVTSSGAWLGTPYSNLTTVIKLQDIRNEEGFICVYFKDWDASYPLGLCSHVTVQISNVRIVRAKSGNTYAETNSLSLVTILPSSSSIKLVKDIPSIPKSLLLTFVNDYQQNRTLIVSPVLICQVTKLVISNKCGGCGSERPQARCSYAGCSWKGDCHLDCKAWIRVEDGTGDALLFLTNENCKKALPYLEMWNIGEAIARDKGFFFHLPKGKGSNLSTFHQLMFRFLKSAYILQRIEVVCRKLFEQEGSFQADSGSKTFCRLYGVDVRVLDASSAVQHFLKRATHGQCLACKTMAAIIRQSISSIESSLLRSGSVFGSLTPDMTLFAWRWYPNHVTPRLISDIHNIMGGCEH